MWSLNVECTPLSVDGIVLAPRFYSERLFVIEDARARQLRDLFGMQFTWADCYIEASGLYHAHIYVFEHNDLSECKLRFESLENSNFLLHWSGVASVFDSSIGGDHVPFNIVSTGRFLDECST
jgi:hypothetical protein